MGFEPISLVIDTPTEPINLTSDWHDSLMIPLHLMSLKRIGSLYSVGTLGSPHHH